MNNNRLHSASRTAWNIDHKHAVLGSRQSTKIPSYRRHSCHVIPFHRGSTLLEFRVPRKPAPAKKCHLLSLRLTCAYRNDLQHMKESTRLHAPASKTPSSPIFCLLGTTYIWVSNIVAMARYCSPKSSTATVQMIFQKLELFLFLLVSTWHWSGAWMKPDAQDR